MSKRHTGLLSFVKVKVKKKLNYIFLYQIYYGRGHRVFFYSVMLHFE